jgi:hypothetical protein
MKQLILIIAFLFSIQAFAQENKTVTLVVSGQGNTKDEAKQNALRSAIEQAFGTFVSSKTEILNDELVKDEIISVANGNIQKFEIISEVKIPDGNYATTLNATVSVSKLISFVESKGGTVEFKGGLFATNILMQELYEKNEPEALDNVLNTLKQISYKSFDYKINASDPISNNGQWIIPLKVDVFVNSNFSNIPNILEQTIQSLSLSLDDYNNYIKLNKPIYPISLATLNSNETYYLRNINSIELVVDFIYSLNNSITRFSIDNGITKNTLSDYSPTKTYKKDLPGDIVRSMGPGNYDGNDAQGPFIYQESKNGALLMNDENFRIILRNGNDGMGCGICPASLFHNYCGSRHDSAIPVYDYKKLYSQKYSNKFNLDLYSIIIGKYGSSCSSIFNDEIFKSFRSLFFEGKKVPREIRDKDIKPKNLGLVISFASIEPNSSVINFDILDFKSLNQIKKISEYKIVNKN